MKSLMSGGALLALVLIASPAAQPAGDLVVRTATGSVMGTVASVRTATAAPGAGTATGGAVIAR